MAHSLLHMATVAIACLTYAVTIFFTSGVLGHRLGFFMTHTASMADKFYLKKYDMEVTPANWTFYMTAIIYMYQAVWLAYGVISTCRRVDDDDGHMYTAYPVLPPILYIVFAFSLACNISWLLIWDREYMEVALVFINLMACTLFICLVVTLRRLQEFGYMMTRQKMTREIWLIRIFVHNGLAMFASWGTVAAIFNFAVVLTYRTGATQTVGSIVSLTIFAMEIVAWWIFDNFVFDKLLRYLYAPYVVLVISLVAILHKNWDPTKTTSIYTATLLALTTLLTLIKTVLMLYRHQKAPVFSSKPHYTRPMVSFEVRGLLDTPGPFALP